MRVARAHEMRNFLLAVSGLVVLLIILVVAINTAFSVKRIDRDQERAKELVKQQFVDYYEKAVKEAGEISMDPEIKKNIDPSFYQSFQQGDMERVTAFLMHMLRPLYSAEYGVAVIGGEISGYATREGLEGFEVKKDAPRTMPDPSTDEVQSQVLESFNGKDGYFISVFSPFQMPGIKNAFFNFVIDRTEEVKRLDDTYSSERSRLILQQVVIGLVAIAVAIALSLLGIRLLTRHFITGPIEEITRISHDIMEGEFKGEVQVDERSDFADLQRLLRSGKMLVDRMCSEEPQGQ